MVAKSIDFTERLEKEISCRCGCVRASRRLLVVKPRQPLDSRRQ